MFDHLIRKAAMSQDKSTVNKKMLHELLSDEEHESDKVDKQDEVDEEGG